MSRTLKIVQNDAELVPPPALPDFTPAPTRKRSVTEFRGRT